jgi:hypothetical protein
MEWTIQVFHTRKRPVARILLGVIIFFCVVLILWSRVPNTVGLFTAEQAGLKDTSTEYRFMKRMERYSPETEWVVTDLPMYAFRVGLPVPPNLAVFTSKRVASGNIDEEAVIDTIKELKPRQVLMGRFQFPELEAYLMENYQLILSRGDQHLYLRVDH